MTQTDMTEKERKNQELADRFFYVSGHELILSTTFEVDERFKMSDIEGIGVKLLGTDVLICSEIDKLGKEFSHMHLESDGLVLED
jgi:hypothetical protein